MSQSKRGLSGLNLGMVVVAVGLLVGGLGAAPAWAVVCGDTIGPGGGVALTGNLGPCATDPALTVVGPVKFSLNGFTVSCATTATDGIVITGFRAQVSNGTVRGCEDGVQVNGDGRHLITRIVSRNNGDDGFEINSHGNTLSFNEANDNGDEGFQIDGSFNTLSFNTARRNESDGFDMDPQDDGGNNNRLINNTAEENGDAGFEIGGDNNVLRFNHANRNDRGFFIEEEGSNNSLAFNVAFANDEDGFDIDGDNNSLTNNLATRNGDDGIDVETGASGNLLLGNFAVFNDQNGNGNFDLEDDNANCDANQWVNNAANTRNQVCVH